MFEDKYNQDQLNSALSQAVLSQNNQKVKELLMGEKKPSLEISISGIPLILFVAQKGNWELVELFYDEGANLDVQIDYLNWFLIHECIKNAPTNVANAIIEYANVNVQTKKGKTPLMIALEEKKFQYIDLLLEKGSGLSLKDSNGNNIAHYAAKMKDYELFLKLAENKVPLNHTNKDMETPIDCIEDVSFKENLPQMLQQFELRTMKKENSLNITNQNISNDEEVNKSNKISKEDIPKVQGLSKIGRK
jgi:ankyrin repeat protein